VYAVEPTAGSQPLSPEEEKLVLGGEVSLWGEEISSANVFSKAFPRASAFAERMWSPKYVNKCGFGTSLSPIFSRMLMFRRLALFLRQRDGSGPPPGPASVQNVQPGASCVAHRPGIVLSPPVGHFPVEITRKRDLIPFSSGVFGGGWWRMPPCVYGAENPRTIQKQKKPLVWNGHAPVGGPRARNGAWEADPPRRARGGPWQGVASRCECIGNPRERERERARARERASEWRLFARSTREGARRRPDRSRLYCPALPGTPQRSRCGRY
jgi:hypothetical protein